MTELSKLLKQALLGFLLCGVLYFLFSCNSAFGDDRLFKLFVPTDYELFLHAQDGYKTFAWDQLRIIKHQGLMPSVKQSFYLWRQ